MGASMRTVQFELLPGLPGRRGVIVVPVVHTAIMRDAGLADTARFKVILIGAPVGPVTPGRGIASHPKRHTLHWAAANGIRGVYTWTQAGNTPMLRLNEQLGYVTAHTSIPVSRALPLLT